MIPLTIEIHGTGTYNRGAELMAIAIAERMRKTFPKVRIVVPYDFGDFQARARHGFYTTWEFGYLRGRVSNLGLRYGSARVRDAMGVIDPNEIDAILDASGFAFSDQWGAEAAKTLYTKLASPPRKAKPLILLPQALGPFENEEVVTACRKLFTRSSLVFARDQQSYDAAKPFVEMTKLIKCPDFTLGVAPQFLSNFDIPTRFTAVVPNYRMLDKTNSGKSYINFLERTILSLREKKLNPIFVLHDAEEDRKILDLLPKSLTPPHLEHPDPRVLKGILGRADFVIGSRFHALVSSLSQGVPCIGVGWSHKYPELFCDYNSTDLVLDELDHTDRLEGLIRDLADINNRQRRSSEIAEASASLKQQSETMWSKVEALIKTKAGNS